MKQTFRDLLPYLSGIRRLQFFVTITLMVAAAFFEVLSIGSIVPLVSTIIDGEIPKFIENIFVYVNHHFGLKVFVENSQLNIVLTIFVILIFFSTIVRLSALYAMIKFTNSIGFDFTNKVYKNVLSQNFYYHIKFNSAETIATLNKVRSIMGGVIGPILQALSSMVTAIGITWFLFSLNWKISLFVLALISVIYLFISRLVQRKLKSNSTVVSKAHSDRILSINEALGNIRELILSKRQLSHYLSFRQTEISLKQASIQNNFISAAPKLIIEGFGIVILLTAVFWLTDTNDGLIKALPIIAAFAFATQKLLPALQSIFVAWSRLSGNISLIEDVLYFLKLKSETYDECTTSDKAFYEIDFENVHFKYDEGSKIFDDLNFKLVKDEVIGVLGATGSGKSTLVDLISSLLRPSEGAIKVRNKNGELLSMTQWQSNIAYVPQTPFFLDQTILKNITLEDDKSAIDLSKLEQTIKISQLSPVLNALEFGLDTKMGERGSKLSGGQLQRIAIARGLYADKPFLILDEATSALDERTELLVLQGIKNYLNGKTALIITHRPDNIKFCDKVFYVKNKQLKIRKYGTRNNKK